MFRSKSWLITALLLVVALPLLAAKKPPTAPGRYEGWGPDIDQIEIVRPLTLSSYSNVYVQPLDVSATPQPEDKDMTAAVEKVLAVATAPVTEGLKKKLERLTVAEAPPAVAAGTLIVRMKVTTMDPGSRGKRMFVGYGAGAARTAVDGEIVDAGTGEVLIRFKQERLSGIERFGRGSSYEEIMKRNLEALGRDVANLLKEF
jgi:hypothetical protein